MKIKLQGYSLISNEWIDKRIETLEAIRDQLIKEDMPYNSTQNRIDELRSIKELQLIPSEKLADRVYEEGSGGFDYDHHTSMAQYEKDKQYFLNSEIEIQ
jgi:hypothetical protein